MGTEEPHRSFWFSFGLERLGLVALKAPYVSAALIVVLTALAIVGVSRIQVDDSLSELFRTDDDWRRIRELHVQSRESRQTERSPFLGVLWKNAVRKRLPLVPRLAFRLGFWGK